MSELKKKIRGDKSFSLQMKMKTGIRMVLRIPSGFPFIRVNSTSKHSMRPLSANIPLVFFNVKSFKKCPPEVVEG